MKTLMNLSQSQTMSSREIAELTGKLHKNVLADCDSLNGIYSQMGMAEISAVKYLAENRQEYREYQLSKMQTFDLMTGYNIELRIKINRRWEELETKTAIDFTNPQTVAMLAQNWAAEQQKRIQAENTIAEQAPKVLFADAVSTATNSCLIKDLATVLKQNGVNTGQNRMFEWLRINGYLLKSGEYHNRPSQKAMELGLFEVKVSVRQDPQKGAVEQFTTKVTGKGQLYCNHKLIGAN